MDSRRSSDAFGLRFDTNGIWRATARYGGSFETYGAALAGNATHLLSAGTTTGPLDGETNAGNGDATLSKRDATGPVVWTRIAGADGYDEGAAAAFDSAGNGYLAGSTYGSFSGATNAGGADFFVARYDSVGNQTLLKQFGISGDDTVSDVKADGSGNIYLTGTTNGNLGGEANTGNSDAFVMKLDSSGAVPWTRLFGGITEDRGRALDLDGAGHVWIGGSYGIAPDEIHLSGDTDAFVAEYDSDGVLLGTTFLSSPSGDGIGGLAIGPDGAAYVTGSTDGVLGATSAGDSDVFVAKITGVPEPSAALLLAGAGAGLLLRRRRA